MRSIATFAFHLLSPSRHHVWPVYTTEFQLLIRRQKPSIKQKVSGKLMKNHSGNLDPDQCEKWLHHSAFRKVLLLQLREARQSAEAKKKHERCDAKAIRDCAARERGKLLLAFPIHYITLWNIKSILDWFLLFVFVLFMNFVFQNFRIT